MRERDGHKIEDLLNEGSDGTARPVEQLLPLVYDELKKLARKQMAGERTDHTLQTTALVHEAYLRLIGCTEVQWSANAQFFFAAAQSMRTHPDRACPQAIQAQTRG